MYQLYHGDCLELMKDISDNSVDCILCDPPYGIVKGITFVRSNFSAEWDTRLDTKELFTHYERILRPSGVLILFSQEPYTNHLRGFDKANLPFLYPMYWKKNGFSNPFSTKVAPKSFVEDISVFRKKYDTGNVNPLRQYFKSILMYSKCSGTREVNKILGHRRAEHCFDADAIQFSLPTKETYQELIDKFNIDRMDGFLSYNEILQINKRYTPTFNLFDDKNFHSNFLEYNKEHKGFHPTAKPVALLEHLIKIYTNENDLVLDNTMGSGSTGVACMNTGRKFIGVEKEEKYFKIAEERIKEASNNLNKFME